MGYMHFLGDLARLAPYRLTQRKRQQRRGIGYILAQHQHRKSELPRSAPPVGIRHPTPDVVPFQVKMTSREVDLGEIGQLTVATFFLRSPAEPLFDDIDHPILAEGFPLGRPHHAGAGVTTAPSPPPRRARAREPRPRDNRPAAPAARGCGRWQASAWPCPQPSGATLRIASPGYRDTSLGARREGRRRRAHPAAASRGPLERGHLRLPFQSRCPSDGPGHPSQPRGI